MFKDKIIKYPISEYFTIKVIKTMLFGIPIASTCYLMDKNGNILKLI